MFYRLEKFQDKKQINEKISTPSINLSWMTSVILHIGKGKNMNIDMRVLKNY